MQWINPKERKPEGKIFWALTEGRPEIDACDCNQTGEEF